MNAGLAVRGTFLSLVLLLGACATAPSAEDEALGSNTQAMTGGGTAFICGKSIDGTIGCICDLNGDDIVMSCAGMMQLCDLIGPGMTCDMEGMCACIVGPTEPQPEDRGSKDEGAAVDPLTTIESMGLEPVLDLPKGIFTPAGGVAYKDNDGSELVACTSDCDKTHSSRNWCDWYCNCTVNEGRDRMTCDFENPYIDLHEPPPPEPFKDVQPGNDDLK
jgi:hypothetical protein